VSQFVGVLDNIDCGDPAIANIERGSLQEAVTIDADIAWQAVDLHSAHQGRRTHILPVGPDEQAERALESAHHVAEGKHLAAAIGMDLDILRQQFSELRGVAVARGGEESACDPVRFGRLQGESRPRRLDMLARA
jgi:hypothetical protein